MPRIRFSRKGLLLLFVMVSVPLAIWRGLAYAGFAFPPDGAHVRLDCGSRELNYMAIVAHQEESDFGLRPYVWKVYYYKLHSAWIPRHYDGQPIDADVAWVQAQNYSLVARDKSSRWHQWRLGPSQISVQGEWFPGGRTVQITIPESVDSETPSNEFLLAVGIPDEVIRGDR